MSEHKQTNVLIEQIQQLYKAVAVPDSIVLQIRQNEYFASDSYKIFMKDCKACLEGWQYFEPKTYPVEERFELDKEAYLNTFYDEKFGDGQTLEYNELELLKRLIRNLKPAKHPYFVTYRKLLKARHKGLKEIAEMNQARYKPLVSASTLQELKNQSNTVYKPMPMWEVVEHLHPLTTRFSKNGKPFLTEEQLCTFIRRAFTGEKELNKQSFNYAHGEKGLIIQLFYLLFVHAVTQYGEKNQKDKYVRLVSDHFTNWDYTTVAALFKPNKTKQSW